VVDRTRQIKDNLTSIKTGTGEYQSCINQLERQEVRAHMLLQAMRSSIVCLGAFAGTALLSILGTAWGTYDQGPLFRGIVIAAWWPAASGLEPGVGVRADGPREPSGGGESHRRSGGGAHEIPIGRGD
jgi:hypothetical protein